MKSRYPQGEFVYVTDETLAGIPGAKVVAGDLVFPHRGAIGEVGLVPLHQSEPMMLSTSLMKLTPDSDAADSIFLYYYFASKAGRDELLMRASTVGTPGIGQPLTSLRQIPVPLPPLEEQRGIAAKLGALDDKIDSNRRAIRLMEQAARLRFRQLFNVEHDLGGVPVSELIQVNPRRKLAKGTPATYVGMSSLPEFFPLINEWETKEVGSGQKFINGDVLMARITPCLENGKTAVVDMLQDGEIGWGSTEYVVLSPQGEITTPWIYCFVRDEAVRTWAVRRMTGSSGRQRFSAGGFDDYRIKGPDPAKLGEFNELAVPMFERMAQLRDESQKLAALRDALLPELLSGRIRVPEAALAVAATSS